jgi:hypothetical protein
LQEPSEPGAASSPEASVHTSHQFFQIVHKKPQTQHLAPLSAAVGNRFKAAHIAVTLHDLVPGALNNSSDSRGGSGSGGSNKVDLFARACDPSAEGGGLLSLLDAGVQLGSLEASCRTLAD